MPVLVLTVLPFLGSFLGGDEVGDPRTGAAWREQQGWGAAGCTHAEPPAPRGCGWATHCPVEGGGHGLQNQRGIKGEKPSRSREDGGSGVGWRLGHLLPDGISPANLSCAGSGCSPGGLSAPQPRSSLGGIRGDETSRKMRRHTLQGICHELLPARPHGAAMSRGAGAGLEVPDIPGHSRVTGDVWCHRGTCFPACRGDEELPSLPAEVPGDVSAGPQGRSRACPSSGARMSVQRALGACWEDAFPAGARASLQSACKEGGCKLTAN